MSDFIPNIHEQEDSGDVTVIKENRNSLSAMAVTSISVSTASGSVVAQNVNRKGLVLTNISQNFISFCFGGVPTLYSGITLPANTVFVMDSFTFSTNSINAIASGTGSIVSIQEFM